MTPRLAAAVEASALLRQVQAAGGFGAVLHRGDAERGSLLLVIAERGREVAVLERLLQMDGEYRWQRLEMATERIAAYANQRTSSDPDLWALELNVPDAERFIVDTVR